MMLIDLSYLKTISLLGGGSTAIVLNLVEIVARIKIEDGNADCCLPPSEKFPQSIFGKIFKPSRGFINLGWLLFGTYYLTVCNLRNLLIIGAFFGNLCLGT